MLEELELILRKTKKAKEVIRETKETVRIISHYDADGICSGAIMAEAVSRFGKDFRLTMAHQLNDDLLESLGEEKPEVVVFLDMGSGYLDEIRKHLKESTVIICDHHQPVGDIAPEDNIIHINPVTTGIDGNISGAGVTYLLARTLEKRNIDLSPLAIIGAIGDSQIDSVGKNWGLNGLNREIMKEAEGQELLKVSKGLRIWGRYRRPIHKALEYSIDPYIPGISNSESASVQFLNDLGIPVKKKDGEWMTISDLTMDQQKRLATEIIKERIKGDQSDPDEIFGDVYELLDKPGEFRDASEFATVLNACGKMDRAYLGISICLNDPESFGEVKKVLESYRREIGKAISWIYRQYEKKTDRVRVLNGVYVLAGSRISEHIISNAISTVNHSGILPEKPVFGMADSERGIKISARASDSIVEKGLDLSGMMNAVAERFGGEGGGHRAAAGATIPKEKQEEFIVTVEQMLEKKEMGDTEADTKEGVIKRDNFIMYDNKNKQSGCPVKEDAPESGDESNGNEKQAQTEGR